MRQLDMVAIGNPDMGQAFRLEGFREPVEVGERSAVEADLRPWPGRGISAGPTLDQMVIVVERMEKRIDIGVACLGIGLAFRHDQIAAQDGIEL